jgi:hypothetical protein
MDRWRKREEGVSILRTILGKAILVMSGQRRMMYQNLRPKPEGTIFSKRSKPQGTNSSPHDTATNMTEPLEMNIQGDRLLLLSLKVACALSFSL